MVWEGLRGCGWVCIHVPAACAVHTDKQDEKFSEVDWKHLHGPYVKPTVMHRNRKGCVLLFIVVVAL